MLFKLLLKPTFDFGEMLFLRDWSEFVGQLDASVIVYRQMNGRDIFRHKHFCIYKKII